MKLTAIALTGLMLAASLAPASAAHRYRHHRYHSAATDSPNGTAGGPTSLSGTGSSRFGGSVPGATGNN